jgi:hypothetical protein
VATHPWSIYNWPFRYDGQGDRQGRPYNTKLPVLHVTVYCRATLAVALAIALAVALAIALAVTQAIEAIIHTCPRSRFMLQCNRRTL